MPVLHLNVADDHVTLAQGEGQFDRCLTRKLAATAPGDPIVLLIHGYRYSYCRGPSNPHKTLYRTAPWDRKYPKRQTSWPRALGFRDTQDDPGLCLAIGWDARGKLSEAFARAEAVGRALGRLIERLHALAPGRPIKLMGHSLGGRVALAALRALPAAAVRQAILLAPADFDTHARLTLDSPAGAAAEILQISPTENWIFDRLLEQALRRHPHAGAALGRCPPMAQNWAALRLESEAELRALAHLGYAVAPRAARVCHWSAYLREGAMDLYSALLTGQASCSVRQVLDAARMT